MRLGRRPADWRARPGSAGERPRPREPVGGEAYPTTWPTSLMAYAILAAPPRVPRSVIVPLLHRKACMPLKFESSEEPTTWCELLIPLAELGEPPSVPRSVILPPL